MIQFFLIRHGTTTVQQKTLMGRLPGFHLDEEGKKQAEALAEHMAGFRFDAIYSSPLERTMETAMPLAEKLGIKIETSDAFHEIDFGDWAGKDFSTLQFVPQWKFFNDQRSRARIPNGESALEIQTRVTSEIETLARKHESGNIAIFSHGDPIRAAICFYLGLTLDLIHRIEVSPASYSVVQLYGQAMTRVYCINYECSSAQILKR